MINHLRPACRHKALHYKSRLIFIHREWNDVQFLDMIYHLQVVSAICVG